MSGVHRLAVLSISLMFLIIAGPNEALARDSPCHACAPSCSLPAGVAACMFMCPASHTEPSCVGEDEINFCDSGTHIIQCDVPGMH